MGPGRARNVLGIAIRVVVDAIICDFVGGKEGLFDVVVQRLGRCNIVTSGRGTDNVREEECEDK